MKIQNILKNGIDKLNKNNIEEANLKAKILLCYILKVDKNYLIINNNQELKDDEIYEFNKNIDLLIHGKPIQYIIQKQEFMGLEFFVNENVLIPQPDTEILVETALQYLNELTSYIKKNNVFTCSKKIDIFDLCTGSGAIAISIAKYMADIIEKDGIIANIIASDISEKALEIAKKNAIKNSVQEKVKFIESNMFENINKKFDMILSNPPYIKTNIIKTLSKDVQREPNIALDGGEDGLEYYRIIANQAYKYLRNSGMLILEIGYNQKDDVIKLLNKVGVYENIRYKKDYSNNNRVIMCQKVDN